VNVFLIATGLTFLALCLCFIWVGGVFPNWKTATVAATVGVVAWGVSLLL
jgi:hypothetical protein